MEKRGMPDAVMWQTTATRRFLPNGLTKRYYKRLLEFFVVCPLKPVSEVSSWEWFVKG